MKLYLLIIGFLMSLLNSYAQDSNNPKWIVKYTPTTLLNPIYPGIHFAVEKPLKSNYSIQAEFSYLLKNHLYNQEENTIGWSGFNAENNGFIAKLELKRLFKKTPNWYYAANFQYIYNNYSRTDVFDATPNVTPIYLTCSSCIEESYSVKKRGFGTHLKIGFQKAVLPDFVVDAYFGIGGTLLNNQHSKNPDLHQNPAVTDGLIHYFQTHYPGSYFLASPIMGVKIGYIIR